MKNITLLLALAVALFMSGCAGKANSENMVHRSTNSEPYPASLQNSITIDRVSGGVETNPMLSSQINNEEFEKAVRTTLINEGLYQDNGKYKLTVMITGIDQPLGGFSMRVVLHVYYKLTDIATNKVLIDKEISGRYTATMSDTMIGVKRLRMANEGAAKENIKALLNELRAMKHEIAQEVQEAEEAKQAQEEVKQAEMEVFHNID